MSSDFSQQEPRCLASLADEQSMQEAYRTGKDLYSTMAAEAFHTTYENCLEFYLDENGKKTDKTNPEGKKRRSSIKGVLLGVMYGRGTASVAEQLHCSVEEAQKIIDDFFKAYPGIKRFVEEQQGLAKKRGYTETAWGRRRILKHITDSVYEFKYNDKRPVDFNPLLTISSESSDNIPQDVKDDLIKQLDETKSYYLKKKLLEKLEKEGIDVIDNHKFIADAERQCVNSVIQRFSSRYVKTSYDYVRNK